MSIKEQISPEHWKALFNAPSAAATYVSTASGGGLEMFKEVLSASKFMQERASQSGGSGYGELVDDLLGTMKGMKTKEAREYAIKIKSRKIDKMREELKQILVDAAAVSSAMPGGDGFKRWLVDMARQVAETKTGGILGIGAKAVIDDKEQAALDDLAAILGV